MFSLSSPFEKLLKQEHPLQIVGVPNPLIALMAKDIGYKAIYLSGGGVSAGDLGLPDLGLIALEDVLIQIRRITSRVDLPLFVDVDTGWGSPLNVYRTFEQVSKAGAFGAHIEDQNTDKRCGHRDGKKLVATQDMVARIKAATDGRVHDDFVVIARTDALNLEGEARALERAIAYQEAGADMIFVESPTNLETYQAFANQLDIPILANMTEFGKTPLADCNQLKALGVSAILYPLTAFRAMNFAAFETLRTLREAGTQESMLEKMQTRAALYETIDYHQFEEALDQYLKEEGTNE